MATQKFRKKRSYFGNLADKYATSEYPKAIIKVDIIVLCSNKSLEQIIKLDK